MRDRNGVIGRVRGRITVNIRRGSCERCSPWTRGIGCTRVSGRIITSGCTCGGYVLVLVGVLMVTVVPLARSLNSKYVCVCSRG